MQLPKYSAIDTIRLIPDRARGAMFMHNGRLYFLNGITVNDNSYDLDDVDRIHPSDELGAVASAFDPNTRVFSDRQELGPDGIESLCNFIPPAATFSSVVSRDGKYSVLRRRHSYSPFISIYSCSLYYPMLRSDRSLRWVEQNLSPEALCSAILGVKNEYDWRRASVALAAAGTSTMTTGGTTVFVGSNDYPTIHAYSDRQCRVLIGSLTRKGGKIYSDDKALLELLDPSVVSAA